MAVHEIIIVSGFPPRAITIMEGFTLNSGIVNLAFYLLVNGGRHPRKGGERVMGNWYGAGYRYFL